MSIALTLWAPGLLDALRVKESLSLGDDLKVLSMPGLQALVTKSDTFQAKKQSSFDCLNTLFHQPSLTAYASIMASAEVEAYDKFAFWLRVDPVQLIPDRDSLVLIPGCDLGITEVESKSLLTAFNEHFDQDKVRLEYASPTHWYLRIKQPVDIKTHSVDSIAYKPVNDFYPAGHAAQYWRSLLNEAQMLFYTHPVNELRRDKGLPEINSVWVWGEGVLDSNQVIQRPSATIWSKDTYLSGLATLSNAQQKPEPASYQAWLDDLANLETTTETQHLIYLDSLKQTIDNMSSEEWLDTLKMLDKEWFTPLLAALATKKIESLFLDLGDGKRYHIKPAYLKRFWRFKKSLIKY